jgi:hypothetical protein
MEWVWHIIWGDHEARRPSSMSPKEADANFVGNKDGLKNAGCLRP